ncbi:hypothetical protein GOV12_01925 [Candidatus Pacearchaeota archaeon]|nr:hypothetical protein [Candidatus Pacearchaeota archaeon]
MVKKRRVVRKKTVRKSGLKGNIVKRIKKVNKFERHVNGEFNVEFKKDYLQTQKYMVSRRKFFLKLGILVIISVILLLALTYAFGIIR